jgi:similar to stage IV sporulation protein
MKSRIEFTAFGVYSDDFVDYLVNSEHFVYDVCCESDIYYIKTAPRNYPAIVKAARMFRVRTKVIERAGLYFFLRRHRRRIGIPFGLLAFFGIIVLMSNYVWDVEITGNSSVGNYRIMEQLDKSGIRTGIHVGSFNANLAELELVLAIDELAWVSIESSGSRINVKVSERLAEDSAARIPPSRPANVITRRTGQLVRADVYRGELLFPVGSGINAGDVIVSGVVPVRAPPPNPDEPGEVVSYHYVHADAVLIVEVIEIVDFYQPFTIMHRARNGRSAQNRSIVFLGRRLGSELAISPHADHVDYSERLYTPTVLGFPLPYRVLEQDYVFRDRVSVTETPAEARRLLDKQIELYETNFILGFGSESEITERTIEFFPDENGIGAIVRYVFRVNAAQQSPIDVPEAS